MRRVRYQVACSLDGYIADERGGTDWIVDEPTFDFPALFAQFDTLVMGRRTYEDLPGGVASFPDHEIVVISTNLRQQEHPGVTVRADLAATLDELRARPGRDIWLFGGGALFRAALELGRVDTVELAVIPVLLGGGRPFLPPPAPRATLTLRSQRAYLSGIVLLEYDVAAPSDGRAPTTELP